MVANPRVSNPVISCESEGASPKVSRNVSKRCVTRFSIRKAYTESVPCRTESKQRRKPRHCCSLRQGSLQSGSGTVVALLDLERFKQKLQDGGLLMATLVTGLFPTR